ncbi:MAG: hydrolase, partial [Oscillospiraceae bacterium]|nr:hydrolase [Oscillospiraceae bacterium]
MIKILIDNGRFVFEPNVVGEIICESYHRNRGSRIAFNILDSSDFEINEGNSVSVMINGVGLFFGVVFTVKRDSEGVVNVTAYDQLRYLKNKDTYVYTQKRASDLVKMIAGDYRLKYHKIRETEYVIPSRVEDNVTLLDMIENALDLELQHTGNRFVFFDNFGKLSLYRNIEMFSGVIIDNDTCGEYRYYSSIDNRFNRVKLSRADRKSGRRETFIASDKVSENELGMLQYYSRVSPDENGSEKARSLLALHNKTARTLYVNNAFGDVSVRGGSGVVVKLDCFSGNARVNRCVHKLSSGTHFMDLELETVDN